MKRKLVFLNLALLAATVFAAMQFKQRWESAKAHEAAVLAAKLKTAPAPPYTPPPQTPPVIATGYEKIAREFLFHKDRNPDVPVPKVEPPPEPPMPPMPVLRGVMNLDGVSAVFSEKIDGPQKEYRPGENVGPFKLVSVNSSEVVFEWNGKPVTKRVDELELRKITDNAPTVLAPTPTGTPAGPKPLLQPSGEPGVDLGNGMKACVVGDTSPAGTTAQGFRKVTADTPFGTACRWEPAK